MKKINIYKLFISLISFISVIIGFIFYFKNKNNIICVDLSVIIKNNAFFNILLISIIFFLSFILVGALLSIIVYCYEVISLSTILLYIINNFKKYKITHLIVFLTSKCFYILIILYILYLSLKMAKIIIKYRYNSKLLYFYIRKLFISSFIAILSQLLNYLLLYKYI